MAVMARSLLRLSLLGLLFCAGPALSLPHDDNAVRAAQVTQRAVVAGGVEVEARMLQPRAVTLTSVLQLTIVTDSNGNTITPSPSAASSTSAASSSSRPASSTAQPTSSSAASSAASSSSSASSTSTPSNTANSGTLPSSTPVAEQQSNGGGGGLSGGAIAGIVVGVVAAIAIAAALGFFLARRRRANNRSASTNNPNRPDQEPNMYTAPTPKQPHNGAPYAGPSTTSSNVYTSVTAGYQPQPLASHSTHHPTMSELPAEESRPVQPAQPPQPWATSNPAPDSPDGRRELE